MPLYQTRCENCSVENQIWRTVADRDNLPVCDVCDGHLSRIIVAPAVRADITPYVSPATGKVINSRVQREYDLKKSGCIENEPGLRKDIARWKDESAEKAFAPIAAGVDAAVTSLVNTGKIES